MAVELSTFSALEMWVKTRAEPPARDMPDNLIPHTLLFVKTHDFLLWLIRHTQRFPKNLRHSYTLKLENVALDFEEAILMANSV